MSIQIPNSSGTTAKGRRPKSWLFYGAIGLSFVIILCSGGVLLAKKATKEQDKITVENTTVVVITIRNTTDNSDEGVLRAANLLNSTMDLSVDPCYDFYEFTCGKWRTETEIPKHSGIRTLTSDMEDKVFDKIKESNQKSSSQAIEKMKILYQSCVNFDSYGEEAVRRTYSRIKDFGYFPMLEGYNKSRLEDINWAHLAMKFQDPRFFQLIVMNDLKNVSKRVILFHEAYIPLGTNWLLRDQAQSYISTWRSTLKAKLEMFANDTGYPMNPKIDDDFDELEDLFTRMAPYLTDDHEYAQYMLGYKSENFSVFTERFQNNTGLNLLELLKAPEEKKVRQFLDNADLEVVFLRPEYELNIIEIIKETSPRTILNFFQLGVFEEYQQHFPERYKQLDLKHGGKLRGETENQPRWQSCLHLLWMDEQPQSDTGDLIGAIYARNMLKPDSFKDIYNVVENLKESFKEMIEEAGWMDSYTKTNAQRKLRNILVKIGFEDYSFDDTQLDEKFRELNITKQMSFINMVEEISRWQREMRWKEVMEPYKREIPIRAADVNAHCDQKGNGIAISSGILQPPFYDKSFPQAWNYAHTGVVIGHELCHGFDNQGRIFGENGEMKDWWSNETKTKFESKAKCFTRQYQRKQRQMGVNLDTAVTLNEDIADNCSIQQTYRAYKKFLKKNGGRDKLIPGFDFNEEQLFFIGYGLQHCEAGNTEALAHQWATDAHSPSKLRVNVVLSNQQEFAKTFKCPASSPMNSKKHCKVW